MGITVAQNDQALASLVNSMSQSGGLPLPAEADVLAGSFYYDTDNNILYQEQSGTWTAILQVRTLNNANETVAAGYYAATTLSAVDADLAVGNIKKDVEIFGFTGTAKRLEDYATNATLGMFQTYKAIGDITSYENINNNNTAAGVTASVVPRYAEVTFGDLVTIKRWRQFGVVTNINGDGVWKIQYWNVETDAWIDWATAIPTRVTADWSGFSTEAEVITTKIKLIVTTLDTGGSSAMGELEVIF